mmetsp:Transcript_120838/g.301546  ORF Transcript_120838/g.301546 Transcript_120838/m.301546 type:complete len:216 (+) Transcript_120838:755-1402(+)
MRELVPALVVLAELITLCGLIVPLPEKEGTLDDVLDRVVAPHVSVQRVGCEDLGLLDIDQEPLPLRLCLLDDLVVRPRLVVLRGCEELVDGCATSGCWGRTVLTVGRPGSSARAVCWPVERHAPVHGHGIGPDSFLHPPSLMVRVDHLVLERCYRRTDLICVPHRGVQRARVDACGGRRCCDLGCHVRVDDAASPLATAAAAAADSGGWRWDHRR